MNIIIAAFIISFSLMRVTLGEDPSTTLSLINFILIPLSYIYGYRYRHIGVVSLTVMAVN